MGRLGHLHIKTPKFVHGTMNNSVYA